MSGQAQAGCAVASECAGMTVDRILAIHAALVAFFTVTPEPIRDLGVRDAALLERAVSHPFTGDRAAALAKPAALLQGMFDELPFHDGNAQTGFIALLLLLDELGHVPNRVSFDAFFDFFAALHDHRLAALTERQPAAGRKRQRAEDGTELSQILRWLEVHTRPEPVRDHPMHCAALEQLLARRGFQAAEEDTADGKVLEISRPEPGEKRRLFRLRGTKGGADSTVLVRVPIVQGPLSLTTMRAVRTACGLEPAAFYDEQARLDSYLGQYQGLLVRLGRL